MRQIPIPATTGDYHYSVIKCIGFVAESLGDAAQASGPADGVFDLDAAAGVGTVVGALGIGQGCIGAFFATPGLAVGQTAGRHVVLLHQTQIAQIGQQCEQVEQTQVRVKLVFK